MARIVSPAASGPLSTFVLEALAARPHELPSGPQVDVPDPLGTDDLPLALSLYEELHNGGIAGAMNAGSGIHR